MAARKKRPSKLPSINDKIHFGIQKQNPVIPSDAEGVPILPYLTNVPSETYRKSRSNLSNSGRSLLSLKSSPCIADDMRISDINHNDGFEKKQKKPRRGSGVKNMVPQHDDNFCLISNRLLARSPFEFRYAAVVIQRIGRGFLARKFVWRLGGPGSIRAILRIQCFARQHIARSLLCLRLQARDHHAACLVQGLFRGFRYGRLEAKRRRVEIMSIAASKVQRIYRGRLTKKWFAAFKAMIRESKTRFLQRCYRGSRARRAARIMRQQLEDGIVNLGKIRMAYMSGALHARVEALLGGGICGRHPVVITKQVEVLGLESFEEEADDTEDRWRHGHSFEQHGYGDDEQYDYDEDVHDESTQRFVSDHGWMGIAVPVPTPNQSLPQSRLPTRSGTSDRYHHHHTLKGKRSLYSRQGRSASPTRSRPHTQSSFGARDHDCRGGTAGLSRGGMGTRNGERKYAASSVSYGLVLSEAAEEELLGLALGCACSVQDYGLSRRIMESLMRCAWAKIRNDKHGGGVSCRKAYTAAKKAAEATRHIKSHRVSAETSSRMRLETSALYREASLGPPIQLLYAYSIVLQLDWASSGPYRILDHKALGEALLICEKCWWAEGDIKRCKKETATDFGGSSFAYYEVYYFRAAAEVAYRKRNGPSSMLDAKVLRNMAVCYHTLYGEFKRQQPRKRGKTSALGERRSWWSTQDAYRRSRALFARSLLIDETALDTTLSESASVFENIFASVWAPVAEVEKTQHLPSRTLLASTTTKLLPSPQDLFGQLNSQEDKFDQDGMSSMSSSVLSNNVSAGGDQKSNKSKKKSSKSSRRSKTSSADGVGESGSGPGSSSRSRRGKTTSSAGSSRAVSASAPLEATGPSARIKVVVYKCGRKCLLRASRIFTASKFEAADGCPFGGWDKESDYPRYIHAPKEEGGGYSHVRAIGRWLNRSPPLSDGQKENSHGSHRKNKQEKIHHPHQKAHSDIVASKNEFLESFYEFCGGLNQGKGKEDGRLCFIGMVIHEAEFRNIEQKATDFFLQVQKRPETTVMAMDPFARFSEFILPRLVVSSISNPSSVSAPPPPPLYSRIKKIGDESKQELYEAFSTILSVSPFLNSSRSGTPSMSIIDTPSTAESNDFVTSDHKNKRNDEVPDHVMSGKVVNRKVFGDKESLYQMRKQLRRKYKMKHDKFNYESFGKKSKRANQSTNELEDDEEFDYEFNDDNDNTKERLLDHHDTAVTPMDVEDGEAIQGVQFEIKTTFHDQFLVSSEFSIDGKVTPDVGNGEIHFLNKNNHHNSPNHLQGKKPKKSNSLSFNSYDSTSLEAEEVEELQVEDVVVMTQDGVIPATKVRWLALHVPALEWMRSAERNLRIKDQAAALLQRCYRGWERKAAWKRLKIRMKAQKVHEDYLQKRRAEEEEERAVERRAASFFQSRFKGWLWRVRLRKMQAVIVCIQVMVRGYLCRRKREAMERERLDGLPVHVVYERGMFVSGVPLLITVKKCGLSYKFIGVDVQKCATYQGYMYGPEVIALLDLTQPPPPSDAQVKADPSLAFKDTTGWTKAIRPWQQERVLELLLSMLALTEAIGGLTKELKGIDPSKVLVVHPSLGDQVKGPTVLRVTGLHRTLKDQSKTTSHYEAIQHREERKKANKQEPPQKSLQHLGKLVTTAQVDTSRMSPAQKTAYERNKMVDVAAYRRLVRRVKPNLRLSNLRYHRPPTPTPEERLLAKKLALAEKKSSSGKLGQEGINRATKDLDDLFKDD